MLSGAGVIKGTDDTAKVHIHMTANAVTNAQASGTDVDAGLYIDLTDALLTNDTICDKAPVYVSVVENDGSITGEVLTGFVVGSDEVTGLTAGKYLFAEKTSPVGGQSVFVDFYALRSSKKINELQIDMAHFGGYFYVEAQSLWRDTDGADHAVEITLPNVKIQSNFTFNYAATGDPSTFNFVMDAFPGYTWFDPTQKVLMAMQVADDAENASSTAKSVFAHDNAEVIDGDEDGDATNDFFADSVGSITRG